MPGKLYVAATPIGNLDDLSLRAQRALRESDVIVCEDTRRTRKLLSRYEISSKKMIVLNEINETNNSEKILELLKSGSTIACVSDAGTPCISDPGSKLIELAHKNNIEVVPVPGPSAITAIFSVAGLNSNSFCFIGFLPKKNSQKALVFGELKETERPVIFFESPFRIKKTLVELSSYLEPERLVIIGKELTKAHENIFRGTLSQALFWINQITIKGEFTVVIDRA